MKKIILSLLAFCAAAAAAQPEVAFPELPLDHPQAPFIMTYAYAQSVGATAEWRKMEGVIADEANKKLYVAMSEIGSGMSDGEGDIALEENPCGAVYVADLDDSNITRSLTPLVVGGPYTEGAETDACDINAISNPDNLAVDAKGRVWIGEDTGNHENNALWVYDPGSDTLTRFATVPLGAEVTGLHITQNGTLFMNVQHPDATNIYPFNRGVVGVVTGFNANEDEVQELAAPQGDEKKIARVAAGAYQILGRVGEAIPAASDGSVFGAVTSVSGELLNICNHPDGNMFLPVDEAATEGYLYSNFECRPGGISKMYLKRAQDGTWNVLEGERVDFASVRGTWNNCFATVTPWGTGLSGEEYPSESAENWAESAEVMNAYLGHAANPFDYGYPLELTPGDGVGTQVTKHYAMGRFSVENAVVLSDQKTAYYGDDGSDRVMYRFVADEAGSLTAGTLYAAKVMQEGETLNLEWIELGHGTSEEVEAAIRSLDAQLTASN